MRRQKSEDIFGIDRLTECSCIMHPSPAAHAHKGNARLTCKSFTTTGPVYSPWTRALLTGGGCLAAPSRSRDSSSTFSRANLLIHEENLLFRREKKTHVDKQELCGYFVCNQRSSGSSSRGKEICGSVLAGRFDEVHPDAPSDRCH